MHAQYSGTRVTKDGEYLHITPRTFDVLQYFVERSGQIVTKDEILGKVWNGSFVEEGNVPVHISKLRRLLDGIDFQRAIETVYGTGYRFTAKVKVGTEKDWNNGVAKSYNLEINQSTEKKAFSFIGSLNLESTDYDALVLMAVGLAELVRRKYENSSRINY